MVLELSVTCHYSHCQFGKGHDLRPKWTLPLWRVQPKMRTIRLKYVFVCRLWQDESYSATSEKVCNLLLNALCVFQRKKWQGKKNTFVTTISPREREYLRKRMPDTCGQFVQRRNFTASLATKTRDQNLFRFGGNLLPVLLLQRVECEPDRHCAIYLLHITRQKLKQPKPELNNAVDLCRIAAAVVRCPSETAADMNMEREKQQRRV